MRSRAARSTPSTPRPWSGDAYLKLADDHEGFLTRLRASAAIATIEGCQRVQRLLVKEVLIGPEKITIRHRIPAPARGSATRHEAAKTDTKGDHAPGYPLHWECDEPGALSGARRVRGRHRSEEHTSELQSLRHL